MKKLFALVLKFKKNLLRTAFPKRDKTELHQQMGTSEQLLSIAEIEIVGKKDNKNGTEQNICRRNNRARFSKQQNSCKSQTKRQIIFTKYLS